MGQYSIWQQKTTQEDTTPISASSPQGSDSGRSPQMSTGGKATLAYGALIARQGYQTAIGEIEARGNEELAREISDTIKQISYTGIVIATGGKALIPLAVSQSVSTLQNSLEIKRENTMTDIKNRLRGDRVRVGGGRD